MAIILPDGFLMLVKQGEVDSVAQQLSDGFTEVNHAEPETGLTALHYAAARNARGIVKLLVATGLCDYTLRDRYGRTAAALAAEVADNPALARYLVACEESGFVMQGVSGPCCSGRGWRPGSATRAS